MDHFISILSSQGSKENLEDLWDRIGNCLSEKSVRTSHLFILICIGTAFYLVLFCYLFLYFRHQIQTQAKVIVITILAIKLFVLGALTASITLVEHVYTVKDDLQGFIRLTIMEQTLIQLACVTNMALTSYFNTKLYLTSIPLKNEASTTKAIVKKITKTKKRANRIIFCLYLLFFFNSCAGIMRAFSSE